MVIFAQPERLWLLVAVVAVALFVLMRHRSRLGRQRILASPAVWDRLIGGVPATGLVRMLMWCFAAALVVLALARPQWGSMPDEVSIRTRDLVLALDVSDSMQCPDVQPNRLGRSLEIIRRALPGLGGNRIGVVVFAGEAYSLIPLTTDLEAVASFLDGVRPGMVGRPGSNLESAVGAALRLLPAEGEGRVVVLFSDGENLQGNVESAASALQEVGAGLLGVVVGTERGGPIPTFDGSGAVHYKKNKDGQPVVTRAETGTFEKMAEQVGGQVVITNGSEDEKKLIEAVEGLRTREVQTEQKPRRIERFPVFLIAAALVLIVSFLLSPWRKRAAITVLFLTLGVPVGDAQQGQNPPPSGAAGPGQSVQQPVEPQEVAWWQRWIPGGSRRLARTGMSDWESGDAEGAVEHFDGAAQLDAENPERIFDLGTALAAQGTVEPAVALLNQAEENGVAGASYNAGTAALSGGQAEAAVELLRRALLDDGDNPEVKRNFELALKMLEEQEQEQEQENQDENQDQDQNEEKDQEEQEGDQEQPTPTPNPSGEQGPQPTPTPDPNGGLFDALDRAEAEAREAMETPIPQTGNVEKDW